MKKAASCLAAGLALLFLFQTSLWAAENTCRLKIGVSLHPYYSWVKNIVGDAAEVMPVIPPDVDPHSYQPVAADMARMEKLDAIVINGIGHDEFIKPMLKAVNNPKLVVINTSKGLPLIPSFDKHYAFEEKEGGAEKVSYNSHTYIAITGAIQQMQLINRELGKLCPDHAAEFNRNLRAYSKKLRNMLHAALTRINSINLANARIATVHDGYSYLFQELGIEVSAVVQPRHGVTPSARQLEDTIKRIKKANVNILFSELDYEKKYVDIIYQETGCRIYALSHISNGKYTKEYFEQSMQKNLDAILQALTEVSASSTNMAAPAGVQESIGKQMQNVSQQMQQKMQANVQESVQKAVPQIQQQQMNQNMGQQTQQMQQKMQNAAQDLQQKQMQNVSQQMQANVQESVQKAVPQIQQQQMNQNMGQQTQQMQNAAQQVQESVQQKLNSAPAAQPQEQP